MYNRGKFPTRWKTLLRCHLLYSLARTGDNRWNTVRLVALATSTSKIVFTTILTPGDILRKFYSCPNLKMKTERSSNRLLQQSAAAAIGCSSTQFCSFFFLCCKYLKDNTTQGGQIYCNHSLDCDYKTTHKHITLNRYHRSLIHHWPHCDCISSA